jgi:hypothetical protein
VVGAAGPPHRRAAPALAVSRDLVPGSVENTSVNPSERGFVVVPPA